MPVRTEQELRAAERRIARSAKDFNRDIRDWSDSLGPSFLVPLHRKLHLQALRGIVLKTPVDTGRARGNWQSTTDFPAEGTLLGEGDSLGTFSKPPSPSVAGQGAIEQGQRMTPNIRPYSVSYVTNNLPYIIPLEAGTSTQAPNGMVALTIEELRQQFP